MVKLTPELINQSLQFINPCRERELNLRGYKIPLIENLGATLDQFDCIDLSDNDLRKLDGFPYLPRIKCILLNNNRILRVGDGIQEALPNLESLVLTGNNLQELADIEPLTQLTRLKNLCLLVNPVSTRPYYREYIVYKLPNLRLLDFKKIRQNDRRAAQEFFRSKTGKDLLKDILKKRNIAKVSNDNDGSAQSNIANSQDLQRIREIIKKANSLQEVENLTDILRSGKIPDNFNLDTTNQMEGIENFSNE